MQIQTAQDVSKIERNDALNFPETRDDIRAEQSINLDSTGDDSPNFKVRSFQHWVIKLMILASGEHLFFQYYGRHP